MRTAPVVRRCFALFLHTEERPRLDFGALLSGGPALRFDLCWLALAPHLDAPVELDAALVEAIGRIGASQWVARTDVEAEVGSERLQRLLECGLVFEQEIATPARVRDEGLRHAQWHPLLATAHAFSRWGGVDSLAAQDASQIRSTADLIATGGLPPPHHHTRTDALSRMSLERAPARLLDTLMQRRTTCRNFDRSPALSATDLAVVLHRAFGEQARETIEPGAVALKKNHPSGGGLHPLEAYLLVRRVESLCAGLYHYNVEAHALDRLPLPADFDEDGFSRTMVAGQHYFADAAVLLVVAVRFPRSFWKYRRHPKIYRAILLEAGHASQNLYLAATDLGLGAYVTAAINEVEIEQAFGLDPLFEGPVAVCGFGPRAGTRTTVELDPAGRVWDASGRLKQQE